MKKADIIAALKVILEDSPIDRTKIQSLVDCLAKPTPKSRRPLSQLDLGPSATKGHDRDSCCCVDCCAVRDNRAKKSKKAVNDLQGWLDIIRDS